MRVAEAGHPVGRELDDGFDRAAEAVGRLLREPIHQIDVDPLEAGLAGRLDGAANLLRGVDPSSRLLHPGIEILDPEAHPSEPQCPEGAELLRGRESGICLDRRIGIRGQREVLPDDAPEALQLVVFRIVGCSAAQMQLHDRAIPSQTAGDLVQLLPQSIEIGFEHAASAGDDHVAAAVETAPAAEREVDVQREWLRLLPGSALESRSVLGRTDAPVPSGDGRVASVSRGWTPVLQQ